VPRLPLLLLTTAAFAAAPAGGAETIALAATPAGGAQTGARSVGLRDLVAQALAHSPNLGAAVADLDVGYAGVVAARGLDDFVLGAGASWNESRRPLVGGTPVQQPALDDVLVSVQLTRPLPTGGTVGLKLSSELTRNEYATDNLVGGFDRSAATAWVPWLQLVLTHPLLRGAGVRTARAQRFRAAAVRDQATLNRETVASVLVRDVVGAYWELAYAKDELAIRQTSASSAREQLAIVKANIAVGKQPPSASAEVLVAMALRDEEALLAGEAERERSLDLERLVGLPLDPRRRLAAAEIAGAPVPLPAVEALLASAHEHNPQLAAAHAGERAAAVDVDVTANGLLPQLDLAFAGGPTGNANDLGVAFGQLGRFQAYALSGSLVLSSALERHGAKGARNAAAATLRKARLGSDDILLQIDTAVLRLVAQIETAAERIAVLAATTDHATLDLEAERARFAVGRATNFDVLRRQDELAQARLRQARARIDYHRTVAALEAVTADILPRYGVELK
jgi:outer membrane protein TolC